MRSRVVLLAILIVHGLTAKADDSTTSQAFWLWLSEYSDADGELLDPLMLDEVLSQEYQETETSNKSVELLNTLEALDTDTSNESSPEQTEGKSL